MSWRVIAYKDVRDAARSKTLWLVFGLLALLSVGYAFAHAYLGPARFDAFLVGLARLLAATLPAFAVLVGYKAVVGERTSGRLFLTLSVPHSRRDLLAGKFVGRAIVLVGPTLVALGAAGALAAVRYGTDGAGAYPLFLAAAGLYEVAFLGLVVGLSASTRVDRQVTLGAFGGYLLLVPFWNALHAATMLVLHRFDGSVLVDLPDWALLFRLAGPSESFARLVRAGTEFEQAARYVADGAPIYVDWWAAVALLVAWCLVPLAAGFWRFRSADL